MMVILSTELLQLNHVVNLANLDRVIQSIFNDAILWEVSCVSHDLMQWFHGSLVEQIDINFVLVLLSGIQLVSYPPDIRSDTGYLVS